MRLRDLFGNVPVVPNWVIDKVKNMTKDYFYYEFSIGVPYREKVDEVMGVLQEIAADLCRDPECADDILAPLEMFGADQFADSAVVIKCPVKTRSIKPWRVGNESANQEDLRCQGDRDSVPVPDDLLGRAQARNATPIIILYRAELGESPRAAG
jgi:moderate conductance mechanosensitive channel